MWSRWTCGLAAVLLISACGIGEPSDTRAETGFDFDAPPGDASAAWSSAASAAAEISTCSARGASSSAPAMRDGASGGITPVIAR
jgi:hypothetical protein